MEERDVRGVYSHPPATGGIRLGGVVAADVGDAIRIDDLRGIKIPYYDGNPSNLDDFILDLEDFAEEVVGEMKGAPRDKWVCRTFPHRLAQDLKEELWDQIREGLIQTAGGRGASGRPQTSGWRICGPFCCRWSAWSCGSGNAIGTSASTEEASSWYGTGMSPARSDTC